MAGNNTQQSGVSKERLSAEINDALKRLKENEHKLETEKIFEEDYDVRDILCKQLVGAVEEIRDDIRKESESQDGISLKDIENRFNSIKPNIDEVNSEIEEIIKKQVIIVPKIVEQTMDIVEKTAQIKKDIDNLRNRQELYTLVFNQNDQRMKQYQSEFNNLVGVLANTKKMEGEIKKFGFRDIALIDREMQGINNQVSNIEGKINELNVLFDTKIQKNNDIKRLLNDYFLDGSKVQMANVYNEIIENGSRAEGERSEPPTTPIGYADDQDYWDIDVPGQEYNYEINSSMSLDDIKSLADTPIAEQNMTPQSTDNIQGKDKEVLLQNNSRKDLVKGGEKPVPPARGSSKSFQENSSRMIKQAKSVGHPLKEVLYDNNVEETSEESATTADPKPVDDKEKTKKGLFNNSGAFVGYYKKNGKRIEHDNIFTGRSETEKKNSRLDNEDNVEVRQIEQTVKRVEGVAHQKSIHLNIENTESGERQETGQANNLSTESTVSQVNNTNVNVNKPLPVTPLLDKPLPDEPTNQSLSKTEKDTKSLAGTPNEKFLKKFIKKIKITNALKNIKGLKSILNRKNKQDEAPKVLDEVSPVAPIESNTTLNHGMQSEAPSVPVVADNRLLLEIMGGLSQETRAFVEHYVKNTNKEDGPHRSLKDATNLGGAMEEKLSIKVNHQ